MRSGPNLLYRLLHKDYPESFASYAPEKKDFHSPLCAQLPANWSIQRREMWFYCAPRGCTVPHQGWKIHVSATLQNCRELVTKVAAVLFRYEDVSFKFALDRPLLSLLNSKSWPRGGSGKFITIYPANTRRFLELIEEIEHATAGMQGPYVLSDHRYKQSRVVFYRYGGMQPHMILNIKGEKVPVLKAPDGAVVPDQRLAYPVTPSWEMPVFSTETCPDENTGSVDLLHGRYEIEAVMVFSSAGGVYRARDHATGARVVVKEARPCINADQNGYDVVEMLKKEHRLLTILADTGITPRPIDLFQEWEHWFLVEEFIEGMSLSHHSASNSFLLRTRPTPRDREEWCSSISMLCRQLMGILHTLHSRNIVFSDLSTNNLMITSSGQELKIIDFEGAYQPGVDSPANIFTPGFISQERVAGGPSTQQDDYYSAGAVLLAYCLPINGLLHLNPRVRYDFLESIRRDVNLSQNVIHFINHLMDRPEFCAANSSTLVEVMDRPALQSVCAPKVAHDYQAVLDDIVTHLNGATDYTRNDRLYPADPRIFSTNPLNLAYGACGVAYALHKLQGEVPEAAVDWILRHHVTPADYPPGLFPGMSGIAWSLLEMGKTRQAEKIFQSTFQHQLLFECPDLFQGVAGWGMTALRFFQATGDARYLDQAQRAGNALLAGGKPLPPRICWSSPQETPLGLAHGGSGIALFLLYLYLSTGNERYLQVGVQALDFDLAAAVPTKDDGLSWSESVESPSPLYPYWRFGSAGIGMATARFHRVLGLPRYQSVLERIFIDTDRKYAIFPGRFTGLAGLGEFLLDMHCFTGEQRFLDSAHKAAEGIMHFRVLRNGVAFPGEMLSRLSCDYGTGSAGIALFLNRLLTHGPADFMLDHLLENSPKRQETPQSDLCAVAL